MATELAKPRRRRRGRWIALTLIVLIGMAVMRSRDAEPVIEPGSYLVVPIEGSYTEAQPKDPVTRLFDERNVLVDLLETLRKARHDDRIAGVVARIGPLDSGWAQAREIRDALASVRASGKKVIAFLSSDVITGIIKANLPCQIAFKVNRKIDSRVILDSNGAEKLLGHGDMLYVPPGGGVMTRAQGAFVAEAEMHAVVGYLENKGQRPSFLPALVQTQSSSRQGMASKDELYREAVEVVLTQQRGSATLLQRALSVGYTRGTRLLEMMEEDGIVGPFVGSKSRDVLLTLDEWKEREAAAAAELEALEAEEFDDEYEDYDEEAEEVELPAGEAQSVESATAEPVVEDEDELPDPQSIGVAVEEGSADEAEGSLADDEADESDENDEESDDDAEASDESYEADDDAEASDEDDEADESDEVYEESDVEDEASDEDYEDDESDEADETEEDPDEVHYVEDDEVEDDYEEPYGEDDEVEDDEVEDDEVEDDEVEDDEERD